MLKKKEKKLSVIICTFNRATILEECLQAVCKQTIDQSLYDIIIIDNNSTDNTFNIVKKYTEGFSNVTYHKEQSQGLSYARNRGSIVAKTEWLAFLDDDGFADPDFIEKCLHVIDNYHFDCFGGIYKPWFKYEKPKWMPSTFGEKQPLSNQIKQIYSAQLDGGIFAINKRVLDQLGGFYNNLGMTGDQIGYGEETHLQIRLLKNGFKLGFTPFWRMQHLVAKHKHYLYWHLKSEFAKGRDAMLIHSHAPAQWNMIDKLKFILHSLINGMINNLPKLKTKDFYFQNFILEVMKPIYYRFGQQSVNTKK